MVRSKTFTTEGIVLKRARTGETDLLVTIFTKNQGKLVSVAKGVRALKSSKRAYLEPGNHITMFAVNTQGLPLLTQARLIEDTSSIRHDFTKLRQLFQILEMIDALFAEAQVDELLFSEVLAIRAEVVKSEPTSSLIKRKLEKLIEGLGYQNPSLTQYSTLTEYVSMLADRPLKSWEYLRV